MPSVAPESLTFLNRTEQLVEQFLDSRQETCRSTTIATYRVYATGYLQWLGTCASETDPFAPATLRAYLVAVRMHGSSSETVFNRFRLLKTLCRWLVDEELLERDPFVGRGRVKMPPRKRQRHPVYSQEDVVRLLQATNVPPWKRDHKTLRIRWDPDGPNVREPLQARALILLLVDSALRSGEVAALTCGHIRAPQLLVDSKGGHKDPAFITAPTRSVLLELAGDRPDDDPLFRDWHGRSCTTRALRGIIQRLAKRAGVTLPPRPVHAFRHYAARQWLKAKLEDLTIMQLMRHQQISTTQLYTHLDAEELSKLHRDASPIAMLVAQAGVKVA